MASGAGRYRRSHRGQTVAAGVIRGRQVPQMASGEVVTVGYVGQTGAEGGGADRNRRWHQGRVADRHRS